ncbi:hypothetical protein [Paraburkholderia azotifigens]|uniref:hypothetical protein n=1 Tax=Paraburkholderia azotifigens TaxID=2057004 RepID=UPI0038BD5664
MNRIFSIIGALGYVFAMSAGAQQTQGKPPSGSDAITVQSGDAGKALTDKAEKSGTKNQEGTLMDKRAKALSPQSASSAGKTGEVRQ